MTDIRSFGAIYKKHSIEATFREKPFFKSFTVGLGWFLCATVYSIENGTFGWWNTAVDVPFLKYMGGDLLNIPLLMPLSFALLMKFYKNIPETITLLFHEGIIRTQGVDIINSYFDSRRTVNVIYRATKFFLFLISGIIAVCLMDLWFFDGISGWLDPNFHITIAGVVLLVIPIALFVSFHIQFVFDQICLSYVLFKTCKTENISLRPYHPDGHFGLEPLKNILNIGIYIGIIFCFMYVSIIATETLLHGSPMAFSRNTPVFIGFIFFCVFLPLVIFLPAIPLALFISSEKKKLIIQVRREMSWANKSRENELAHRYKLLKNGSSLLFAKPAFRGYLISTIVSLLGGIISKLK